jgi:RNA polymerase sigma-70 factor (ECF subfamily)
VSRDPDESHLRLVRPGDAPAPAEPQSTTRARQEASVPASSLDDVQLLRALRAHDAEAATAFHDRVRPQVDRTIYRLLGRRDADHEDLVQLSLIELIYSIDRFRGDCSLDSWTSTVTAHVVYKHLRRRGTERRIFAVPPSLDLVASGSGPSTDVVLRGLVARVRMHLDSIAPAKAWAFLLHDVCGYDLREAATIMDVSVAAAQQRLVRGRRELHELIGADPELANWRVGVGQ